MKKFILSMIVALVSLGVLCGCEQKSSKTDIKERLDNSSVYAYYHSLSEEDKDLYVDICVAIENNENMNFGEFDTYRDASTQGEKVSDIFSSLIYEQPQYFWIDPYGLSGQIFEQGGNELTVYFSRLVDMDELDEKKEEFDQKVFDIVCVAETKKDTFEKVLYVYDKILENASYDYDLGKNINDNNTSMFERYKDGNTEDVADLGQTAYGCLVDGKTVCSGYTLAFNLIMQELGYECGAVSNLGLTGVVQFGGNYHVSNYCKLDGEYYYFDLTWDDTIFDSDDYKGSIDHAYKYFGITSEEFEKTHAIQEGTYAPECTGTKYNYFVYNNMYFEQYDYEAVKQSILEQSGKGYVALRFSQQIDTLKAQKELIDEGKIYSILNKDKCSYVIPTFSSDLYIFFK